MCLQDLAISQRTKSIGWGHARVSAGGFSLPPNPRRVALVFSFDAMVNATFAPTAGDQITMTIVGSAGVQNPYTMHIRDHYSLVTGGVGLEDLGGITSGGVTEVLVDDILGSAVEKLLGTLGRNHTGNNGTG